MPSSQPLTVSVGNLFDRGFLRHIDRLGNRTGDERLYGRHHLDMTHVVNRPLALEGLEGTVEDGQMLLQQMRGPFDRVVLVDVVDDGLSSAGFVIAERVRALRQRSG